MRRKALVVVAACLLVALVALLRDQTRPPVTAAPPEPPPGTTLTTAPGTALPGPAPHTRTPPGRLAERVKVVGEWLTVPSTPDVSIVDNREPLPRLGEWELTTNPLTARRGDEVIVLDTAVRDVERCGTHVYWPSDGELARWAPGSPRVEVLALPDTGTLTSHRCVYGILNVVTDEGTPRLWFLGAP